MIIIDNYVDKTILDIIRNLKVRFNSMFDKIKKANEINDSIIQKVEQEKNNAKYIFKESFIIPNPGEIYKELTMNYEQDGEINFDEINNNFDLYYCFFVNKIISYLYDNKAKNDVIKKMKMIYLNIQMRVIKMKKYFLVNLINIMLKKL